MRIQKYIEETFDYNPGLSFVIHCDSTSKNNLSLNTFKEILDDVKASVNTICIYNIYDIKNGNVFYNYLKEAFLRKFEIRIIGNYSLQDIIKSPLSKFITFYNDGNNEYDVLKSRKENKEIKIIQK